MLTNTARAAALDALDLDYLGAHSGYPGHTGANELAGGVYARGNATFDAATGTPPTRSLNAAVGVPIPAGSTVRWVVVWSNSGSPDDPIAVSPNGGSPKEFVVDLTNNRILCEGHGYSADDKIVFYGGSPPGGLTEGTVYFVLNPTSADPDHFQVAATAGGSAIDLTSQPDASCVVSEIVEETFAADGQLNVATYVVGMNF